MDVARLALATMEGIGIRTIQTLERHFGSASGVFQARNVTELMYTPHVSISLSLAARLLEQGARLAAVEGEWNAAQRAGVQARFFDDPLYPPQLRTIRDAPPVLFVLGRTETLHERSLAIVGTRRPSVAGRRVAEWAARTAVEQGWRVVSGLARGVDAHAHQGSLSATSPYGRDVTVGVLGCGFFFLYPPEHGPLAAQIRQQGALVTEYLWGHVRSYRLVQRNRLISGLSVGILLVEADLRDGALHTMRFGAEQRRHLGVWDWGGTDVPSEGTRALREADPVHEATFADWLNDIAQTSPDAPPLTLFEKKWKARPHEPAEGMSGASTSPDAAWMGLNTGRFEETIS